MPSARFLAAAIVAASMLVAQASARDLNVLFLGDRGHHVPAERFADLEPAFAARGIHLEYTEDLSRLSQESLDDFDALLLYANIDRIEPPQAKALLDYVAAGGGFVPLHCASFCFRNDPEVVALIGAQFQRHGTGVFSTVITEPNHELMRGFGGFESWDETYVHTLHNEEGRTVLEYRVDDEGREPWTWVRTQGDGRVFYTAWGHDQRTWRHPGFVNLVERGVRWAAGDDPALAGPYRDESRFPVPEMTPLPEGEPPFEYVDAGGPIPNYPPSRQWGVQAEPFTKMQAPAEPEISMTRISTPVDFYVELFAAEPELGGKPICMAWDERGRLWVAETYDYPNELQPEGKGRDRIRICEDTDGDGRADQFTVFAEGLSIPTSIAFWRGGAIVQNGIETIYLKDLDGDDRADLRQELITGWALGDTHGGVSNFRYGLDNWIWAMQGYNDSRPVAAGVPQGRFRMGFFRFRPEGTAVEFLRSTNNNTWGLGLSEEGIVFGSTANHNPSVYMPIPNRYYERVRGWTPSLQLGTIADTHLFAPITDRVRQVDQHGGYTAGAGHALYTARAYPSEYWNRVAFVNGPTGHLTGAFVLSRDGADYKSTSPFNLFASDDEWTAPIMAEVGPDGAMWVIDWYNYIVQHNPTPRGFETGRGNAYDTPLRDKTHGRIYRVVYDSAPAADDGSLAGASPSELVAALGRPNMTWRLHAQRLLVERGEQNVVPALIELVNDRGVDEIGLNPAAIHALWTLHGLGALDGSHPAATEAAIAALTHPSAGVRRNSVQVLPISAASSDAIVANVLLADSDAQVQLAALLALADLPPTPAAAGAIAEALLDPSVANDRWLPEAAIAAAANNDAEFLAAALSLSQPSEALLDAARIVAEHYSRGEPTSEAIAAILEAASSAPQPAVEAVVAGLANGASSERTVELSPEASDLLLQAAESASGRVSGELVRLGELWGVAEVAALGDVAAAELAEVISDPETSDAARLDAVRRLLSFRPTSDDAAATVVELLTPQLPPDAATELLAALEASESEVMPELLVEQLASLTPLVRRSALPLLLRRPASTAALLDALADGQVRLSELSLDQQRSLAEHPDRDIRRRARSLLESQAALPSPDRQAVIDRLSYVTEETGDPEAGRAMYEKHCSKCHTHGTLGSKVGPDLTGMNTHPKAELLVHIMDPSRSVEGDYRLYTIATVDGRVLQGMLAAESTAAVELFDAEGKKQTLLRDDVEYFVASPKSLMPEGFEQQMQPNELRDLLEFLTQRGRYAPLDLTAAATSASDRGMFNNAEDRAERLVFDDWSAVEFNGVPFRLIDPQGGRTANVVLLNGPQGTFPPTMPRSVDVACGMPVGVIHVLGGVAGWASPLGREGTTSMIVRLHYADGTSEDHPLLNGVHIADYIRRVDVPESEFAFDLRGRQVRYLAIRPERTNEPIERIELVKGTDATAPVVVAITVEQPAVAESEQAGETLSGE